ncbi:MAG: hypothetical protein NVS2B8_07360 [Vulcanimicrobiaceae bacterium]
MRWHSPRPLASYPTSTVGTRRRSMPPLAAYGLPKPIAATSDALPRWNERIATNGLATHERTIEHATRARRDDDEHVRIG